MVVRRAPVEDDDDEEDDDDIDETLTERLLGMWMDLCLPRYLSGSVPFCISFLSSVTALLPYCTYPI